MSIPVISSSIRQRNIDSEELTLVSSLGVACSVIRCKQEERELWSAQNIIILLGVHISII
jgi:hypothetical protein